MTVENTSWQVSHAGNGSTQDFAIPFSFLANSDLLVIVTDATGTEFTKTLFVNYTVTGAGDPDGGSLHMLVAPTTGQTLTIYRVPSLLQSADLEHNDSLPSTTLERMSDLLTMSVQHLHTLMKRTLRFSFKDEEIDERRIEDAKGKYPFFNASGDLTFVTGDPSQPLSHDVYLITLTAGQTVIPVAAGYTPGSYNLSVYKNRAKQIIGVDYTETTSSSITLTAPAAGGEIVELGIGDVYNVTTASSATQRQTITGATGNAIALTTITYIPGTDSVNVIVNGESLHPPPYGYTETNPTTITLPFSLISTDMVTVEVGRVLDSVPIQDGSVTEAKLAASLDLSAKTITLPATSVTASNLASTLDLSAKTVTLPATSVTNPMLSLPANASAIKTALNASGSAPIFACRAWGNFNGSGSPAFRASGNMNSSITDVGVGIWDVTFDTAMPDANYVVVPGGNTGVPGTDYRTYNFLNQTASGFRITCMRNNSFGIFAPALYDAEYVTFAVFR